MNRYTTIPFSSNLGQSFFKMSKLSLQTSESLVDRYERYCQAKPQKIGRVPTRFVSWKPVFGRFFDLFPYYCRSAPSCGGEASNQLPTHGCPTSLRRPNVQKRKDDTWMHIYSFSLRDRRERLSTIETGEEKGDPIPSLYTSAILSL